MEKSYYRMRNLSWLEGVVPGLLLAEYDMIKQYFLKLNQIPIQNRTILPLTSVFNFELLLWKHNFAFSWRAETRQNSEFKYFNTWIIFCKVF